jgi:ribosome recycling factor
MDKKEVLSGLKERMEGALSVFENELKGLRTGRASSHFLDAVFVEAYGDKMHISQLGTVSTPDARTVAVQVWDNALLKTVEKAIADANLGVNTITDGGLIRIPIPAITEERRKELAKLAHKYGEGSKVSIRNIRRDGIDIAKKMEKDGYISEDEVYKLNDEIQELTDSFVKKIDLYVKNKETEILSI